MNHDFGPWPRWITASYEQSAGEALCDAGALYDLPAAVLCHDTSADPVFVFANLAAQELWERHWDDFIGWPSRLTAPPEHRGERAQALAQDAVVRGYSGVRVSASGRLFRILDATVWPVVDETGQLRGQAATFAQTQEER